MAEPRRVVARWLRTLASRLDPQRKVIIRVCPGPLTTDQLAPEEYVRVVAHAIRRHR